jgi:ribosomal protein S18 acetylase RimI-like enzyme
MTGGGDRRRYNAAVVKMRIREARPEDVAAIAQVHVDSWRTTYQGIVASEFLASLSYEESERMWRKGFASSPSPVSLYLAETPDSAVVGFAAAGPERESDTIYPGEVYAIYLLQNYQRQGIGRELFRAGGRELERRGLIPFLLWVLKANPARHFYQALGGKFLREKEIQIGNERLMEVAYGWGRGNEL